MRVVKKLSILSFLGSDSAKQFSSAYFSGPIFIIQILKINFDSLSTSGEAGPQIGLRIVSTRKLDANRLNQKGDSWAQRTQVDFGVRYGWVCYTLFKGLVP